MATALRAIGRLADAERPSMVVATGGYASGAALAYARFHGIPYVLQDQNSFPGKTIRLFAPGARRIYLGFPEAAEGLPAGARAQVVHSGNPVEPPPGDRPDPPRARTAWGLPGNGGKVLLVFGGSQGSAALNRIVDEWVTRGLPPALHLIWATGRDHYEQFRSRASARVVVRAYLAPIAEAYAVADLALTRAGAMTTAELCAWGVPMILIPLPTAAEDHQTANARALSQAGAALWLPQSEATVARVDAVVREVVVDETKLQTMREGALRRARPHAADEIARDIAALLRGDG
jgi:UDP-N-acetylglucosamine--N-acetylmuramyl-(pentapeptide) pyrophosphoryl-undecaprenol N-acetylglucosamine transferase